jgi:hypothetical protein
MRSVGRRLLHATTRGSRADRPRHRTVQIIEIQADTGWNKVAVDNLYLKIGKGFMLSEAFLPEFQSLKAPFLRL